MKHKYDKMYELLDEGITFLKAKDKEGVKGVTNIVNAFSTLRATQLKDEKQAAEFKKMADKLKKEIK